MSNAAFAVSERQRPRRVALPNQNRNRNASISRVELVDWAAVAVLAFEVPSLLFSQYRANSLSNAQSMGLAVLVYFLVRLTIRTSGAVSVASFAIATCGAVASSVIVWQFIDGSERLRNLGFKQLVAFRSRLVHPPSGWVAGEWLTVLLLALPFACATAMYLNKRCSAGGRMSAGLAAIPAVLIVGGLALSLSRGVFWSTAAFVVVGCSLMALYRVVTVKGALVLLAGCVVSLIVVLSVTTLLYPQMFSAYGGRHTSQVRSMQGRIEIWKRSANLARAHPLWGIGSSNSALFLLSSTDEEDTTGFASRSFSLPVQLLTEKGVIGFTLYGAFILLLGFEFHRGMRIRPDVDGKAKTFRPHRNRKETRHSITFDSAAARRAMNCCFAAGIIAVLCRELTYSSLFEHSLTLVLFAILAALVQRAEEVAA